jgi:hypothetical protein
MKKYLIVAAIIACGLLLIGAAQNDRTQWEYAKYCEILDLYAWDNGQVKMSGSKEDIARVIGCPNDKYSTIAFLNYAGKEGWELCEMTIVSGQARIDYIFKRPK